MSAAKKRGKAKAAPDSEGVRTVARNRKARHEYEVLEEYEAGLVLKGAEVKSLRDGKASFTDSFARVEAGEVWLHNLHITPYEAAQLDRPDPKRPRKLLLHRRQIQRLATKTNEMGFTLVPLDIHFRRGHAKVTLALARGKKQYDRREDLKKKAMKREAERAVQDARRDR
jgi:SsrA-binding protein